MGNQMLLLFVAFLLWFCHEAPTAAATACKAKEKQALMELKAGLRDSSGRLSSWVGEDCCTWSGVACNNQTGHVIRLNLRNPDDSDVLEGKINPSLVQLGHLRYLDLSNNDFGGVRVPSFIGTFKELRYLNLSWSVFSGTVPYQLGNLSSLRSLDLSNNYNYGSRLVVDGSHWLSQLSSLRYLDMSSVNLGEASNCLQALSTLPSIREIHLVGCQLGTIPFSLPHVNFTSLSLLDISYNFISTKMPNWLFNLTGLEFLYLSENQFQGLLPDAIGNMTSLKELDLSTYDAQIRIPETFQKLCRLRTLDLSGWNINNSLDGLGRIFSGCIRNSLSELDLSSTLIGGSQPNSPSWLFNLTSLQYLGISMNGYISAALGNMTLLETLDLSGSNLEGSLSLTLGKLCRLRSLYLSDCNITLTLDDFGGTFSGCIGNSLTNLDLSHTLIGGGGIQNFVSWLFNLSSLQHLSISINGSVPTTIDNMTSLETLDLSGSNVEGPLPFTLGKLCRLRGLYLRACNITATLDDFGGIFSGCIGNSLSKLDLSGNLLNGILPEWLFNLESLQYLDLSQNAIHGSIPASVGRLSSLGVLHLASNMLNGTISKNLGKLSELEDLDLHDNSLEGILSEAHFANLIELKSMDLRFNNLTIDVSSDWQPPFQLTQIQLGSCQVGPEFLARILTLEDLHSLDLSHANITGTLDDFGGNFSGRIGNSLSQLDLSGNLLNGVLPEWLFNLKSLQYLDLSQNAIHGSIPASVERLSSLRALFLRDNMLNGTISENLGKLSELEDLDLRNNTLEGILSEVHFADLTKLYWMDLSFNNLTIDVSSDWQPPFQLTHILLQSCQVGPEFPAWILTQEALQLVDLSYAKISGSVPDRFWNLTSNIHSLDLSNNNISGPIPLSELEAMSRLEFVDLSSNFFNGHLPHLPTNVLLADLSNNSFSGPIPQGLVKKQSPLGYLSLSMNNINGTIPSNLCELENLEILVLSNNQISGEIPHCLLQSSTLTILDISSNKISGMIPNFTSSASSLKQLHLNNNSLSGELPYFLKSCQKMVILDLGHNKFSGKIPSWVGESLSSLRILSLRSNLFNGELPQMLHQLTTLQILDLSHNHLSGTIPQSFGNFTTMKHVNMNPLNLSAQYDSYYTGSIILEDKGLDLPFVVTQVSLVVAMDLSDNNLLGTIPKELVDLHGLQILNVSRNNLSGGIMAGIGELRQLQSLDLSRNQLSGGIPLSMCSLSFLESLNLSYNNFSGKIPSGGQLNTFDDPSIYAGNHDLCGFPLTNDCMGDENTTIIPDYARIEEDEMLWFYLGIMAGFGLGFWGIWGILLVKRSWRYSYYRFIDKLYVAIRVNFGN